MTITLPAVGATPRRPGPGSVAWKVHRERLLLLSWGRAILLQFAHPLVASAVAEHSQFGSSPAENRRRLLRTVRAMLDLTFGQDESAASTAARIDAIHGRIVGTLAEPTGAHAAATPYAARMPELLRWVYATLLESSLIVYERYVGPLPAEEQDRYCAEARSAAALLGLAPELVPATRAELDAYMQAMYREGQVAVGDTARALTMELLRARPLPLLPDPLLAILHLPTIGLLPEQVRAAYGLGWGPLQAAALAASSRLCRLLLPLVPRRLRDWPASRQAPRQVDAR